MSKIDELTVEQRQGLISRTINDLQDEIRMLCQRGGEQDLREAVQKQNTIRFLVWERADIRAVRKLSAHLQRKGGAA